MTNSEFNNLAPASFDALDLEMHKAGQMAFLALQLTGGMKVVINAKEYATMTGTTPDAAKQAAARMRAFFPGFALYFRVPPNENTHVPMIEVVPGHDNSKAARNPNTGIVQRTITIKAGVHASAGISKGTRAKKTASPAGVVPRRKRKAEEVTEEDEEDLIYTGEKKIATAEEDRKAVVLEKQEIEMGEKQTAAAGGDRENASASMVQAIQEYQKAIEEADQRFKRLITSMDT